MICLHLIEIICKYGIIKKMKNLRVLSIGWENTQQNSRYVNFWGKLKIVGWDDKSAASTLRHYCRLAEPT
jgi:hypothetical protein